MAQLRMEVEIVQIESDWNLTEFLMGLFIKDYLFMGAGGFGAEGLAPCWG